MKEEEQAIASVSFSDIPEDSKEVTMIARGFAVLENIYEFNRYRTVKVDMNIVLICRQGRLQFKLNGRTITVERGQIVIAQSGTVTEGIMASLDLQCTLLLISNGLVKSLLRSHYDLWNRLLYVNHMNIIQMPDIAANKQYEAEELSLFVRSYIANQHSMFKEEIVENILRCTMLNILGLMQEQAGVGVAMPYSQSEQLFNRFLENLNQHKQRRHTVSEYAQELIVSPKYLSAVCKAVSGKSALQWINEYVVEDIRQMLSNTTLSIKEISTQTGFPNLSFFGKYVKRHLGMSPKQYRKSLK